MQNFPNLGKDIEIQILAAQRTPSKDNQSLLWEALELEYQKTNLKKSESKRIRAFCHIQGNFNDPTSKLVVSHLAGP